MSNISAIEPLPTHYEQLGGQQLFWGEDSGWQAQDYCRSRTSNPRIGHGESGIAHPSDEIHEVVVPVRFAKPDRIADLTPEAMSAQKLQRAGRRFRREEDIQVLGGPVDSGVLLQGEGAGNRVWDPMVAEEPQNVLIKTLLIRVEVRLRRRTHWQDGSFQGHGGGLDVTQ
jgi:hypothetical protein